MCQRRNTISPLSQKGVRPHLGSHQSQTSRSSSNDVFGPTVVAIQCQLVVPIWDDGKPVHATGVGFSDTSRCAIGRECHVFEQHPCSKPQVTAMLTYESDPRTEHSHLTELATKATCAQSSVEDAYAMCVPKPTRSCNQPQQLT